MRLLIQRVSEASVKVEGQIVGQINNGLLVLVGIETEDAKEDLEWLANKLLNLRIFNDADGVMNKSIQDVNGDLLLVSQFTLHASTKKGNRPSYIKAARPEIAEPKYDELCELVSQKVGKPVEKGVFGADMQVTLTNSGPVTIWIDSKNKE